MFVYHLSNNSAVVGVNIYVYVYIVIGCTAWNMG